MSLNNKKSILKNLNDQLHKYNVTIHFNKNYVDFHHKFTDEQVYTSKPIGLLQLIVRKL